jgi:plasmid stabilization system protein ParE
MRVIIDSIADIDGLAAWVGKDSPQRARTVVQRILETIDRLNLFPGAQGC